MTSRLRGQARRYLAAWLWVARDALPRFAPQVATIVVCNITGLLCALSAVWGVMAYARHAEHGRPVKLLLWTMPLTDNLRSLLLFGAAIGVLGLVSALCMYVSDRLILSIARRYHAACAERVLVLAANPCCRGWQATAPESPRAILARVMGTSSRAMGMTLRDILRTILPLLTVMATIFALFVIDFRLTLVLLPLAALYLVPLYLINRRVTRMQRRYRETSPEARGDVSRRLRELLHSGDYATGVDSLRRDALDGVMHRGALHSLYGRMLADRRVHLLNSAFFIACLVALLVFFGMQAREHGRPWSDLIFYLLALRYTITALRQTTTLFAKFSRFFPECQRYASFVNECERLRTNRESGDTSLPAAFEGGSLRLGPAARWDSPRTMRIDRTGVLWVLTPWPAGYAELEAVTVRLAQRLGPAGDHLASQAGFAATPEQLSSDQTESTPVLVVSSSLAARPANAPTIDRLSEQRAVMIVGNDVAAAQASLRSCTVVIMDGSTVVAGGDLPWLRTHADAIAKFLDLQAERTRHRGGGDSIDDDEDEEEE